MKDSSMNGIIVTLAVAIVAIGAWWYLQQRPEPVPKPVAPTETAQPVETEPAGPMYPVPEPPPVDNSGKLVELPPLDDSDGYFSLALLDAFGSGIEDRLVDSGLIERFVATIDNLPRSHIAERIRPMRRLATTFRADALGDETFVVSQDNATRYDVLVDMLTTADPDQLYATYQRFYPLLQQAYVNLGYPDGYFNDRVVEVIDHLLDTPVPAEPPELIRPHVLFNYADPELESLSSGQKLLIRTGPDNAAAIKAALQELRERIA